MNEIHQWMIATYNEIQSNGGLITLELGSYGRWRSFRHYGWLSYGDRNVVFDFLIYHKTMPHITVSFTVDDDHVLDGYLSMHAEEFTRELNVEQKLEVFGWTVWSTH